MGTILRFLCELFFPLPLHACQWPDPKPNKHPFTYIAQLVSLSGWGRQTNFLPSTIMQSNKGVWCQVAGQQARRICRTILKLLVIIKTICDSTCCHQWSCVLVMSYISKYTDSLKSADNWLFYSKDFLQNNFFLCDLFSVVMSWILRAC